MKRYPIQIVCSSKEERDTVRKILMSLKMEFGGTNAEALINYFNEKC